MKISRFNNKVRQVDWKANKSESFKNQIKSYIIDKLISTFIFEKNFIY